MASRRVSEREILHRDEIARVLQDQEVRDHKNDRVNRLLFRLSCCCGLRRKEISGLNVGDVDTIGRFPTITITKANTKGQLHKRRSRQVPLWWDEGTRFVLHEWKSQRLAEGALQSSPFVCAQRADMHGQRIGLEGIARRWRTAIRVLGGERVKQLSIHTGRHSFCSHALAAGRSLMEVSDAAGHADLKMTERYIHLVGRENVPDVFSFNPVQGTNNG